MSPFQGSAEIRSLTQGSLPSAVRRTVSRPGLFHAAPSVLRAEAQRPRRQTDERSRAVRKPKEKRIVLPASPQVMKALDGAAQALDRRPHHGASHTDLSQIATPLGLVSSVDMTGIVRGRDLPFGWPRAQIRTQGTTSYGSYLGCPPWSRTLGYGCRMGTSGSHVPNRRLIRGHLRWRPFWLRRRKAQSQARLGERALDRWVHGLALPAKAERVIGGGG